MTVKTLLDVCEFIIDCEHKTAPLANSGYPSIRTPNVGRGRLQLDGVNRIDEPTYQLWTKRAVPQPGDLIIAREAPVGNVALITKGQQVCLGQRTVLVRPDRNRIDERYLTYLLLGDCIQASFHAMSIGATVPHLNMKDIRELVLPPLPDRKIQTRIGDILSAYDDLMENNTRRIAILEEMARRIFEEWFVHFRAPGCEGLPMVDSAVGPVPQGWEVKRLDEFVETQYGYTTSAVDLASGPQFLRGMDLNKRSYIDWATVPYCSTPPDDTKRFALRHGDVLVIRMADPGKVGIVERDLDAVFASYLVRLRFDQGVLPSTFVFHLLTDRRYQDYVLGASNGTTRKSIPAPVMTSFDFAMPPPPTLETFDRVVAPLRRLLNNLVQQNANLRAQRDMLLPKLISGEIDISSASASLKEAAE
jgi:type I restriction enzyme S subunit